MLSRVENIHGHPEAAAIEVIQAHFQQHYDRDEWVLSDEVIALHVCHRQIDTGAFCFCM